MSTELYSSTLTTTSGIICRAINVSGSSTLNIASISSLSTSGVAGNLNVSGSITTLGNVTTSGNLVGNGYVASIAGSISDSTVLNQGAYLAWNYSGGGGETNLINKAGVGANSGFYFYNSSGNASAFSNGKNLLMYVNSSGFAYFNKPCIRGNRTGGWSVTTNENVMKGMTLNTERSGSGSSGYNSTSGIWVAPQAGFYQWNLYVRCQDTATGGIGVKPATTSVFIVPNSDNTLFYLNDGQNRRYIQWSECRYLSAGEGLLCYSTASLTVQDVVFSCFMVSN